MQIVEYTAKHKSAIKTLNIEWLEKYFWVEERDEIELSDPEGKILDQGGFIYYLIEDDTVVGTASLLKISPDVFELGKMAVTASAQGKGYGKALMDYCIREAKDKAIPSLILYSNTKLERAISLYRAYGFKEVPLEAGIYERANIKMELKL